MLFILTINRDNGHYYQIPSSCFSTLILNSANFRFKFKPLDNVRKNGVWLVTKPLKNSFSIGIWSISLMKLWSIEDPLSILWCIEIKWLGVSFIILKISLSIGISMMSDLAFKDAESMPNCFFWNSISCWNDVTSTESI